MQMSRFWLRELQSFSKVALLRGSGNGPQARLTLSGNAPPSSLEGGGRARHCGPRQGQWDPLMQEGQLGLCARQTHSLDALHVPGKVSESDTWELGCQGHTRGGSHPHPVNYPFMVH
jgi:hypothetical protein